MLDDRHCGWVEILLPASLPLPLDRAWGGGRCLLEGVHGRTLRFVSLVGGVVVDVVVVLLVQGLGGVAVARQTVAAAGLRWWWCHVEAALSFTSLEHLLAGVMVVGHLTLVGQLLGVVEGEELVVVRELRHVLRHPELGNVIVVRLADDGDHVCAGRLPGHN